MADLLCMLSAIGVATIVEGTTDPLWVLCTLPFWSVLAKIEGLYDADHPKIWHLTADEAPATARSNGTRTPSEDSSSA